MIEQASQNPYGGGTVVPPPPDADSSLTQVAIRTMASDLAMLGQTGGSTPLGETLSISFDKTHKPEEEGSVTVAGPNEPKANPIKPYLGIIVKIVLGILGLGLVIGLGYYFAPKFMAALQSTPTNTPPQPPPPGKLPDIPPPPTSSIHASFLRLGADAQISINIDPTKPATSPTVFSSEVAKALENVDQRSSLIELGIRKLNAEHLTWPEFLTARNALLLPIDTFVQNFEPDFTAFLYRDAKGIWPGYIIKLKSQHSPIIFGTTLLGSEKNIPAFMNLLVTAPSVPPGTFHNARIVGEPVRSLDFATTKGDVEATLSYGFFYGDYLIFSASDDGLRQILQKF